MKQVLFRKGEAVVEEVPAPRVEAGSVLVRVAWSCVSSGTELASKEATGRSLVARALEEPAKALKVLDLALERGVGEALGVVRERAAAAVPAGYSAAGTVIEVGAGVSGFAVGDRVACAGARHAHHAEVICVPRNLAAPVPEGVTLEEASFVALGAIALQGVRRAAPTLGETFVVIGLGLVGQLAAQLLRASGTRVVGLDLDAGRCALARELGAHTTLDAADGDAAARVRNLTDGHGADGVLITASSAASDVVSAAFRMCRRKGRAVLVGDVGLDLKREELYEKELDFLVSTSYGPGRYDTHYEEQGLDYPIGYVRWTENRNMREFLARIAGGDVDVKRLIGERHEVSLAAGAYASLAGANRPVAALIGYSGAANPEASVRVASAPRGAPRSGRLRLAIVGAGNFAKGAHLPALRTLEDIYCVRAVASRTGHNASEVARQCGAEYATTDYREVLADADVDAVLIATRHDRHAEMALAALAAGKHVLLEKPLAIAREQLEQIRAFYGADTAAKPVLLTGFNRRFSPHAQALRSLIGDSATPALLCYRMNAGPLPADSWVHGPEGGGRNLGEACHVYDLFGYLTGSRRRAVSAHAVGMEGEAYRSNENFCATVTFEGGSVATLAYTALGDPAYPKEQLDAFFDGAVARLDDYRALQVSGRRGGSTTRAQEKGLREELAAFHAAASGRGDWPIPLWQQIQATEIALEVEELLVRG